MKKMNRKGFTLIELLAVIVVLAIILVITVPTILNTLGDTRKDAFEAGANSVADWFEKNYSLAQLDSTKSNSVYNTWAGLDTTATTDDVTVDTETNLTANVIVAAGLNATDVNATSSTVKIKKNGRACVKLVAGTGTGAKFSGQGTVYSSGCEAADKSN
ncbi:MAG: prepilin-type N-terminal cleavage/methylation domain-containing protein [Firmicutes bacterium]|nr:prepilin-type N-terminal cleavage/methylation domain-containing protein [Bacillota bacterium]